MTTRRRATVTTLYPRSSAFKAVEKGGRINRIKEAVAYGVKISKSELSESEKGDTEDLGTRRELTCSSAKVDLVGGYYDAGNNVKFGLPMAFTTTMLAWSITEFGDNMKSELGNAKAALPWSSYYLVKASTTTPDNLYVQEFYFKYVNKPKVFGMTASPVTKKGPLLLQYAICFDAY
ncbi:hypothetical protein SSX86_024680 [Deinandra increscens subsp. villosa]|uniref:cellulase n=1 Tax=Deinandra increscens subsp. villosa TaxID=3103831 RepID=A0AAP0CBP1_9ASTR